MLQRFYRPKLYLAGFSWGTVLGTKMAHQYPELLYAYIGISQMANQNKNERLLLKRLKKQAKEAKNKTALAELSLVKIPLENRDQLFYQRKWLFTFSNNPLSDSALREMYDELTDLMFKLSSEAFNIDFTKQFKALQCPSFSLLAEMTIQQIRNWHIAITKSSKLKTSIFIGLKKLLMGYPLMNPIFSNKPLLTKFCPKHLNERTHNMNCVKNQTIFDFFYGLAEQ